MNIIETNLYNHYFFPELADVLSDFPHDYNLDHRGILRRNQTPVCPNCNQPMNKNGYNVYTKKNLGSIKIGRWICPVCYKSLEEDRSFWENMKDNVFEALEHLVSLLRKYHVSYIGASEIISMFFNRSKESVRLMFKDKIERMPDPEIETPLIIHYDEQHPKQGRNQKFRLTLMNGINQNVIAEGLFDDKSPETILKFLGRYIDPDKPVFIITDIYSSYPSVFKDFFNNGFTHQLCILHLNKLICKDFKKMKSLKELRLRYEFLNIFYDRSKELRYLDKLIGKEQKKKGKRGYKKWLKNARNDFFEYIHKLENRRRRKKEKLRIRPYNGAIMMFNRLVEKYDELPEVAQKRLLMISEKWENLTAFYEFRDAPMTNNAIENYYSTSLKTDKKKQFRTDYGIEDHMKLSRLFRAGELSYNGPSIIDVFNMFIPFRDYG